MHGSFFSHHFYHKWVTSDTHKDYHDVSHNQEDICCVHPHCKSKRCGTYIKLAFLLFQWIWTLHQQMLFSIFLLTRCFSHLLYPQLRHLVWQFHHSFSVPMSFLSLFSLSDSPRFYFFVPSCPFKGCEQFFIVPPEKGRKILWKSACRRNRRKLFVFAFDIFPLTWRFNAFSASFSGI